MRRFVALILVGMLCVTGFVGFASQEANADFTVMWAMDLPRQTYFIGETVTFTVTAFASTDPTLFIPGELAQITIRNQSLQEMYSGWITTNSNGSAVIDWDIPITADPGNYTIILTDTHSFISHQSIEILYNEETYWKTRVDLLQREIDKLYTYVNFLFAYNKWLTNQVNFMRKNFTLMWIIAFLAMLAGLYNFMYVSSRSKKNATGIAGLASKGLTLLGIGNESPIYLQHEEVAQQTTPVDKLVPIYGRDFHCQVCAHKGLPKIMMTEKQLEEHIVMEHDKSPKKFKWKYRFARAERRQKKIVAKEQKKTDKKPTPRFGTPIEIAKSEIIQEKRDELLRVLKTAKALHKKGKLSDDELRTCLMKTQGEMERLRKESETPPQKLTPRETPSPIPESQRKARSERQLFSPKNIPTGNSKIPDKIPVDNPPKTAIDELLEQLNHEKVT